MHIPIYNIENGLSDSFKRKYHYLRLSITEQCNFRCNYCLPNGYLPSEKNHQEKKLGFLNLNEILRVVDAFTELGVKKIRITGGEPTIRKDFLDIVTAIKSNFDITTLALTTNGYRMEKNVAKWHAAGINALNVSIDSLDPKLFFSITGDNRLASIMQGIENAFTCGYQKIKVNSVLLKGLNDKGFDDYLSWIKDRPIQMRFIELMKTGKMDSFFEQYHFSGEILEKRLLRDGWMLKKRGLTDGPAKVYYHPDYVGEIGLIMPYSKDFCTTCNRLRVSAKGKLHLCLFGEQGFELRELLQDEQQKLQLKQRIHSVLQGKHEHHFLHEGNSGITPHLASIGG